jgi:micrococcal nuclease
LKIQTFVSLSLFFAFLLLLTACTNSTPETVEEDKGNTLSATVIRVIDGDTVKIKLENGKEETVRLLLIDTPESVHPSKPVQPFGKEASQFLKNSLPEGSQIEVELGINERDTYGRLLAYVYHEGEMVNKQALQKGLARVAYVFAPNTKYIDEFRNVQEQAQQQALGIWSIENYATDHGFDETMTVPDSVSNTAGCENPQIKGNISSKSEKIYHIPSGQHYRETKPEEWFCSEKEAVNAGFRKSKS